MSKSTKELIFQSFLEVLSTKPFDKITVRDIVENCNMNRNTFYYYYADIYELLEEMFKLEFSEIKINNNNTIRLRLAFSKLLETSYSNKKIIKNICASKSYDYLESFMFKSTKSIITEYIQAVAEPYEINESYVDFISSFYHYGITETLSEWYRTGMQETPKEMLRRFTVVLYGIQSSIKLAENK